MRLQDGWRKHEERQFLGAISTHFSPSHSAIFRSCGQPLHRSQTELVFKCYDLIMVANLAIWLRLIIELTEYTLSCCLSCHHFAMYCTLYSTYTSTRHKKENVFPQHPILQLYPIRSTKKISFILETFIFPIRVLDFLIPSTVLTGMRFLRHFPRDGAPYLSHRARV